MVSGHPFLATNLLKAAEHAGIVISDTVSMCTSLLAKQAKSAIYALTTVRAVFRHRNVPAKSIPTISKDFVGTSTRFLGRTLIARYWGLTLNRSQPTNFRTNFVTSERQLGIQKPVRMCAITCVVHPWSVVRWAFDTACLARWLHWGIKRSVLSGRLALANLLPTQSSPSWRKGYSIKISVAFFSRGKAYFQSLDFFTEILALFLLQKDHRRGSKLRGCVVSREDLQFFLQFRYKTFHVRENS